MSKICPERFAGTRPGHRGPEPPVLGGREAADGGGEERQNRRAEQAQDSEAPRCHESQVQDVAAEVEPRVAVTLV